MENREPNTAALEQTLSEFSVFELDERLEFVAWCDTNCRDRKSVV